MSIMIKIK